MDALRKPFCASRKDHLRNETRKQKMVIKESITRNIEKKQLTWSKQTKST